MSSIKPGSLVRAVTLIGGGAARTVYAQVLNVSDDLSGENGEPSLTLAFMSADLSSKRLSGPDWYKEFERRVGVPHASAEVVKSGAQSVYWTDALPAAGDAVSSDKLEPTVAVLGAEPYGNIRSPIDLRTGTSVVSDGQGAFIIVTSDDVAVVNKDTDQPRRFTSVDEAVEYQDTLPAAGGPIPVTAEGKTQEQLDAEQAEITAQLDAEGIKRDGVTTDLGHNLPPKPEDVSDAAGQLRSSESLIPFSNDELPGTVAAVYLDSSNVNYPTGEGKGTAIPAAPVWSVSEENGKFFVKDSTGDYLLGDNLEAREFGRHEEAQAAIDSQTPLAPPVENDGATKVVEGQ